MYYVLEIQENKDAAPGTLIFPYEEKNDAESKYHAVLSAAAISSVPVHAAFMLTANGYLIKSEYYMHEDVTPEVSNEG